MTITFEQYIEAIKSLPLAGSTNVPVFKVVVRPNTSILSAFDRVPAIDDTKIVTFEVIQKLNRNGRREWYWKPQATIVPCSE